MLLLGFDDRYGEVLLVADRVGVEELDQAVEGVLASLFVSNEAVNGASNQ